ncbi:hypothetical protein pgond44_10984 [Psychroflexus gondwanensis ACAM 44]|jgi:hypothetical protein|uniref:Sulfotransferase domain-containing protein n=1 Tax=Psychroflexus gondwanensis ACAM 44 TaxID=1189619 RepID=N1WKA7_9FLAO|nr:hypothetical protein [Psychroflexus gondwanensis]EMY80666.1 hypothetical protein pgond44_10984 [Psychroflexus gondwanensis ACAM 44]
MNKLYVHIGPPKTATTSFQYYFIENKIENLTYQGVKQPRVTNDDSICKILYNDVINKTYDIDVNFIEKTLKKSNVLISEEMFLVEQNQLSWKDKLKYLSNLLGQFDPVILIVLRNPIDSIRSYYQELFYNLDKSKIKSINDFALSEYCSIYDYSYLISFIYQQGFNNIELLKYERLIKGKYKLNEVFNLVSDEIMILSHQNKSIKNKGKFYAKNNNLRKTLIHYTPSIFRNKFSASLKKKIIGFIPNLDFKKGKEIDKEINSEISIEFLKKYNFILKSKYLVE